MRHPAIWLAALWASTASAQEVTGTVRARPGGSPVAAAVVVLSPVGATRGIGTLTDDTGRFRLRAPSPGTFVLRIDVVGYRSVTTAPIRIDSASTLTRDLEFPFERAQLSRVAVTAASACARVADETGDAPQLWSEARKTLEASRLAEEERRFTVALRRFERTIGLPDSVLQDTRTWTQTGVSQNPFESLPPEVIAREGYSVQRDSTRMFYAPDAQVLLSDAFVAGHCFGTRRGGPDGAIGLTFRPQRVGTKTDISGVLWLDSATAELRSLEYRYAPSVGRQDVGGGSVSFGRYPSGVWGVQRWTIRLPVLRINESTRRPDGALGRFVDTVVVAVREIGGEVMSGTVAPGATTRLSGTVFDSTKGRPLAGAVVTIEGLGRSTDTDADGRFSFDSLADDGEVRVRVWHPRLDSLALPAPVSRVRVQRRGTASLDVTMPNVAAVADARCGRGARGTARIVTGVLRGPTGDVQAATEVLLLERRVTSGSDSLVTHVEITSDGGRYAFCAIQPGSQAWILARAGADRWIDPRHIPAERAPAVEVIPLQLPLSDSATTDTSGTAGDPAIVLGRTLQEGPASIKGWVLLPEHSEARVQVLVDDVVRATAAPDGSFLVPDVAPGTRRLVLRTTGLLQRRLVLEVVSGQSQVLLVSLRPGPRVVVQVVAPPLDQLSDFRQRRRAGGGTFIDKTEIDRRQPRVLSDLMRGVPGVRVEQSRDGLRYLSLHFRRMTPNATAHEESLCDMMIYVDGQPFQGNASAADVRIRMTEVAGIEVYTSAASVPRQFAGANAACGVIMLWLVR